MSTAALQGACQAGTAFAKRFFERHPFPWPDITAPMDGPAGEARTAGRWDSGSYTPEVQSRMQAGFAEMADAEAKTLQYVSEDLRTAWRETANAEFSRRLHEVACLPAAS